MSLHAQPTPAALLKLEIERRNSTISSMLTAVLFLLLTGLILGFFLLKPTTQDPPEIIVYPGDDLPDEPELTQKRASTSLERNPTSPSDHANKVLTTSALSPISLPVPDEVFAAPTLEFGDVHDFGTGWSSGQGDGTQGGGGGGFGTSNRHSGGLEGFLYDLKQDSNGQTLPYSARSMADFAEPVIRLQQSGFSESSLAGFFRSPKPLYLSHVAIPQTSASKGPELFGAKDSIKPSGWVAHYRGKVIVPENGTYRFSGVGDDYMVVYVDGKPRLFGALADLNSAVKGSWKGSSSRGDFRAPYKNRPIVYGDWISLRAGQEIDIDIALGERPGGEVWFFLNIEKRGVKYRKDASGRPILPLFTTVPFSDEEITRLRSEFGGFEFDFDHVPVFKTR